MNGCAKEAENGKHAHPKSKKGPRIGNGFQMTPQWLNTNGNRPSCFLCLVNRNGNRLLLGGISASPRMMISPLVKLQSLPKICLASFKRGPA